MAGPLNEHEVLTQKMRRIAELFSAGDLDALQEITTKTKGEVSLKKLIADYKQRQMINLVVGNGSRDLGQRIARCLGWRCRLIDFQMREFGDGEFCGALDTSVRNQKLFILQSGYNQNYSPSKLNDEVELIADAAQRADVGEVILVAPYFNFAGQDRKDRPRSPLSFKTMINSLIDNGVDKFINIDIHSPQLENAFPCRNSMTLLRSTEIFGDYLRGTDWFNNTDFVLASPDVGGMARVKMLSKSLGGCVRVHGDKEHKYDGSEVDAIVGDVQGKKVIIIDDMIRSGGSILSAAQILRAKGATEIGVMVTHPILCPDSHGEKAQSILARSQIDWLITTNTIDHQPIAEMGQKHIILDVAPRLAKAMSNYIDGGSMSELNVDKHWST